MPEQKQNPNHICKCGNPNCKNGDRSISNEVMEKIQEFIKRAIDTNQGLILLSAGNKGSYVLAASVSPDEIKECGEHLINEGARQNLLLIRNEN